MAFCETICESNSQIAMRWNCRPDDMSALAARKPTDSQQRPARPGRPPRVNAQAIIRTAIEIGLEGVTLKQVADRLGVAVPTLYRHVRNRDELVRLAAFQITLARAMPQAEGLHWSALAQRYAESLYASFMAEPQLIGELLKGRLGPHAEVDVLEQFLAAMAPHGFTPEEGAQLFHAIGMIAIGAAAGSIGLAASKASGLPWSAEMRRTLAERDPAELPRVRRVLPALLETESIPWQQALQRLLAGIELSRASHADSAASAALPPSEKTER
jgi:AcrR family transcriptional regulator